MAPTTAPNFIHLTSYGEGCPDEYDTDIQYETGDVVTHIKAPGRKVVYQCKVSIRFSHTAHDYTPELNSHHLILRIGHTMPIAM
jgi:hypothetical protein